MVVDCNFHAFSALQQTPARGKSFRQTATQTQFAHLLNLTVDLYIAVQKIVVTVPVLDASIALADKNNVAGAAFPKSVLFVVSCRAPRDYRPYFAMAAQDRHRTPFACNKAPPKTIGSFFAAFCSSFSLQMQPSCAY